MARSGLYKSDVKRARDALIVLGKHPSLDAVRIELGNTGSKTTIHKYLKELEVEDGDLAGRKTSISEALHDFVERLAAQLQDESRAKVDAVQAQSAETERQYAEKLEAAGQQVAALTRHLHDAETRLREETQSHHETQERLQKESIARHTAEQQVVDFKERLLENQHHSRSLEEKHQHAREALDHYRTSVKEQREQDARRHEQQVQQLQAEIRTLQQSLVVKQEEATRLNQEGVRLVADLTHTKQGLYDRDGQLRQLQQKLDTAHALEERCRMLASQLGEKVVQADHMKAQLAVATQQVHGLQVELAAVQAKLEAQRTVAAEFREHLEQMRQVTPASTAPKQDVNVSGEPTSGG